MANIYCQLFQQLPEIIAFVRAKIRIFRPDYASVSIMHKGHCTLRAAAHSVGRCRIFVDIKAIYRVLTISPSSRSTSLCARFISLYWGTSDWRLQICIVHGLLENGSSEIQTNAFIYLYRGSLEVRESKNLHLHPAARASIYCRKRYRITLWAARKLLKNRLKLIKVS